jgi:hypothetical protein
MNRVVRYFQSPAFTATEWSSRNPFLNQGEVGYLIENGLITRSKCGPGLWNSLPFIDQDNYPYTDAVTNPLGDVTSAPTGLNMVDVMRKIISPYQVPAAVNLQNNLGGSYMASVIREVGESFNTSIQLNFTVFGIQNLLGATPVVVDGGGIFVNGSFANTPPLTLTQIAPPLAPAGITTVTIGVSFTHVSGTSPVYTTTIKFLPKVMWLSSLLSTISSGTTFMGQSGRQALVTNTYLGDYAFSNGGGYSWIAIPSMLNSINPVFTEVSNPNLPLAISMESKGTISINNGVGTYNYDLYRSTYSLIKPTILRIA